MPHRFAPTLIPADVYALLSAWLIAPLANLTGWLSNEDWDRLIGPFGGLLLSVVVAGIMLRLFVHSMRQARRDADKRHAEMLSAHNSQTKRGDDLVERLLQISVEGILAQGKVAEAIRELKGSHASCPLRHEKIAPPKKS